MRYPASEKLEIIRLVERSHLSAKRTLDKPGIPRTTFHRWYDRCQSGGPEALEDRSSRPSRVWNRIPGDVRDRIVEMALDDYSRYIIAWQLCTTMKAEDTLELALPASGCDQVNVIHKPRLLSDNGASYISGDLAAR
jgi:transposase InsO family protein